MALWASIRVLLWKNWRVKQRESRLNRHRTARGQWLFPALVTDIVLPLTLLLLFICKLCEFNAAIGVGLLGSDGNALALEASGDRVVSGPTVIDDDGMTPTTSVDVARAATRTMRRNALVTPTIEELNKWQAAHRVDQEWVATEPEPSVRPVSSALFMTVLPLLLQKTNQSIAVLDRTESRAFLHYLDREYPASRDLGIASYRDVTKIIPFEDASASMAEVNNLLRNFPARSGYHIYAALDVRPPDAASTTLELVAFLRRGNPQGPSLSDQMDAYFSQVIGVNETYFRFPGILSFQSEVNLFLRRAGQEKGVDTADGNSTTPYPPEVVCRTLNSMLKMAQLEWTDFSTRARLGKSVRECEAALRGEKIPESLRHYVSHLVRQAQVEDELRNLRVSRLPKRPQTTISGQLEGNIVFCIAYLFLWPYVRLVRDIVLEKEKQLKEYMLIMGLRPMALLISWFLLYLFASTVIGGIAVALLGGTMFVGTQASACYFFLLLIAFACSILFFGVAITPIFNRAKTAAACASLVYFVLGAGPFIRLLVGEDAMESSALLNGIVSSLEEISSPVVFMAALRDIMAFDAVSGAIRPIAWEAVSAPCKKMVLQSTGYLLLGWYLENVFPRTYGVQQKWYFILLPSYWMPSLFGKRGEQRPEDETAELLGLEEMLEQTDFGNKDETLRELPLREYVHQFKPILFVNSLSKRYPDGKEAVKHVSFGVKKGEIFGLLGPNGAGKSTTMSILCGMLSPTSGDAIVGGTTSVAKDPEAVRKSLSVCFQQNILFDELSVREHLYLVCALKNAIGVKTVSKEAWEGKLKQFGLEEKQDALSKTLSGGQKRKLSLVLALLDSSRVVLLDEPTAGMDLKARLDTWDALKRAVSHRAVILTTHSMQEAQTLCENIGIVAEGRLKCCGSSLFLRERFGVGYKLTLVHHENGGSSDDNDDDQPGDGRICTSVLIEMVRKFVPQATLVSDNKWETRIQLTDGKESAFVALFNELEAMKARREIKRYAVAATDLEDVFVKVTEGESVYYHAKDGAVSPEAEKIKSEGGSYGTKIETVQPTRDASRWQILSSQLRALYTKRWKMTIRDKKSLLAQYVWPVALFAILLAAVQHLSVADRSIQTLTSLPISAAKSSFYLVASKPEHTATVQEMLKNVNEETQQNVLFYEAGSEKDMFAAILTKKNATSFFAAAFISHIRLPETDSIAEDVDSPFGSLDYSLFYNTTISKSLPVGLEILSEAYCRTIKEAKSGATSKLNDACHLAVKTGVLPRQVIGPVGTDDDDDSAEINISTDNDSPDSIINIMSRMVLAYYLLLTMSSIVSYYISPIVKERESGLKRQQYLHLASTATSSVYWISNFIFDYVTYALVSVAVAITMLLFSSSLTTDMLQAWFVGMLLFGIAVLPFTYLLSLVFSSHSSAQSFMSYVSLFQILAASIVSGMSMTPGLCTKVYTISYFLQFFPLYAFGMLVTNVATLQWTPVRQQCLGFSGALEAGFGDKDDDFMSFMTSSISSGHGEDHPPTVWDWDVGGSNFCALFASALLYSLLLLAFDEAQMYPTLVAHKFKRGLRKLKRFVGFRVQDESEGGYNFLYGSGSGDIDANAVETATRNNLVEVTNVYKVFNPKKQTILGSLVNGNNTASNDGESSSDQPPSVVNQQGQVVALNDVSFSVEKNDCVALLGVNGSGKSTMFEILTAGTAPTRGKATIDKYNVTLEPKAASMKYGYCPQTNVFFSDLTVREHLELFYRLRRRQVASATQEHAIVNAMLTRLDLFPVEKTTAGHLSGGNKRRLMLALSLLSDDVSLLLLDEPSAGVDVVARRLMWRVLHEKRQSNHRTSCLFTTHSMEEAEAVCANAVVLFKGNLVWCGSIPDLKQHASRGVSISLRLDSTSILASERVKVYVDHVRNSLSLNSNARTALELGQIRCEDLKNVWRHCHQQYRPLFEGVDTVPPAAIRHEQWIESVVAKLQQETQAVATVGDPSNSPGTFAMISIEDFVKEWLIQEDFAVLEHFLMDQQIAKRSGEGVKLVDLQAASGSGSNTNAVYETSCTDAFGLADLFDAMESSKSRFRIAQYSVSELSLERVFEQFT
uniref:ABC transporter domain-containing protein n=1 Tax=Globisporangium ultimum (strain ATCC 200006 / CBS 805.95 / DAOM BR144) TaxID=431595 RepID=K3WAM3_GLOUD